MQAVVGLSPNFRLLGHATRGKSCRWRANFRFCILANIREARVGRFAYGYISGEIHGATADNRAFVEEVLLVSTQAGIWGGFAAQFKGVNRNDRRLPALSRILCLSVPVGLVGGGPGRCFAGPILPADDAAHGQAVLGADDELRRIGLGVGQGGWIPIPSQPS